MIIVEGCDKCGKTSMAAALSERLGWPVVKFSQPKTADPCREYADALAANPRPFVADRFHLGEFVYGPLYRGTAPDSAGMGAVEDALIQRRALLVLMDDDADSIRERFDRCGESFARHADVPAILRLFEDAWRGSRVAKTWARWGVDPGAQRAAVAHVLRLAQECTTS